jgi:hypothetical protein
MQYTLLGTISPVLRGKLDNKFAAMNIIQQLDRLPGSPEEALFEDLPTKQQEMQKQNEIYHEATPQEATLGSDTEVINNAVH